MNKNIAIPMSGPSTKENARIKPFRYNPLSKINGKIQLRRDKAEYLPAFMIFVCIFGSSIYAYYIAAINNQFHLSIQNGDG